MSSIKPPIAGITSKLPTQPGIYRFIGESGEVLYVGKAINLKNRVSSYFNDKHIDRPWIKVMMGLVKDVETIVVDNELEALLLEASFIKEFEPKFNIKLTDDKSYPFIALNNKEDIPRFSVVRRRSSKSGATYFGPYLSAKTAASTLEFLRNLYGVHINNKPLKKQTKPCFYCQLSGHSCILAGEKSQEEYTESIKKAVEFLNGRRKGLIKALEERMEKASEQEQYELAAKLRDRLTALKQVSQKQQVISGDMEDYDTIGRYAFANNACVVVHSVREGRLSAERHYFFKAENQIEDQELVKQFLVSYYRTGNYIAKKIIVEGLEETDQIEDALIDMTGYPVSIVNVMRGDKKHMLELANKNAKAKLELKLLKKNDSFSGLIALQEILKLEKIPNRIEAIDISNLGSSEAVGACVCFIDGQPDKNEYRRYIIKTVKGQNDFAMIAEVVGRRLADSSRPAPDLLLIDGGIQQLRFALEAASNSPMQAGMIIGLAKKPDRVFIPGRKLPLSINRNNKGLRLLARARDEVHRFGLSFQRHRQSKKSLKD